MLILGLLIGATFGIFLLARFVAGQTQNLHALSDPAYQAQIEERIAPVGRVAIAGQEPADEPQPVDASPAPAQVAMTGPQVYNTACFNCHGAGIGGAPKVGEASAWTDRIDKGMDVLNDHAINGFQGSAGYMPPKGGRIDLSDQEIIDAVEYMVAESR